MVRFYKPGSDHEETARLSSHLDGGEGASRYDMLTRKTSSKVSAHMGNAGSSGVLADKDRAREALAVRGPEGLMISEHI